MVEAAGLKPKKIADGDGWSFWPQCCGRTGRKREWIYGYYFPRPYARKFDDMYNHWEVRYARDRRYKLYDNGDLYDTVADVLERNVIAPSDSDEQAKLARKKLRAVLDSYPKSGRGIVCDRVTGAVK
jgi:arylsulfatase A